MYDFQKANMWKRISAALCDLILLAIVVVGFAFLLASVLGLNGYITQFDELQTSYKKQYGIVTQEMYDELPAEERANYIIENNTTVRQTAKQFGISKSTVHKDLTERLSQINESLASDARKILDKNKSERHIRGGLATKDKYLHKRNIF